METPRVDFLAVIIAAIVNVIIGFVWYSRFLFGKQHVNDPRKRAFLWNVGVALLSAAILGILATHLRATTVSDGMFVGFLVWLGFVMTTQLYAVIWAKMPWKHFAIHAGCQLLTYLSMGGIIGA